MAPLVPFLTRHATNGMVCSVDHLASSAGVAMLRAGGSAADAAVAASAVLAVTTQHMCGMGGDLFAVVHDGAGVSALNASGRAGSGADPDRLRAEGATEMPFRRDIRSTPVPGCVDGWLALHERHGRLPLAEVLAPARSYAADGFPASPLLSMAATFLLEGVAHADDYRGPVHPGTRVRRPGVARTLDAIVREGRDGFYGGEFGQGLLEVGGGEYVDWDLARDQADWVEPLSIEAWGSRVWTIPPNSQGYLALAGAWIADGLSLPDDADDPATAHLLVEAAKQAGFDRLAVLSEGADGPALLAPDRLAPRRASIDPGRAATLATGTAEGGTIYLCAVDRDGMAVSLIQSNAKDFGAHIVERRTGIFLHNRGIGFSLVPGHPAEYGPGKRPTSTLSPVLVTDPGGGFRAVLGTMGGDSQPQVLLQLLARMLRFGQSPADAIAAPRWALASGTGSGFDTWVDPSSVVLQIEGHAPPSWDDALRAFGHTVQRVDAYSTGMGHAHTIVRDGDGVLGGAADPRALTGSASGY
jgi:gamma-glutamyltranspeptidase/glutathione hydrolase